MKSLNSGIYFIAEIGINHNGDMALAKKLIDVAKEAGCDAVKFQKRTPDICVPESMKSVVRETPWGNMTYLDYKKRIEFEKAEYDEIKNYCDQIKIDWSASAWDIESLQFLDQYSLPFHKVASALATNLPFLQQVASRQIPTIASVGMCEWNEIDDLVGIFESHKCELILLHTVSTYPADEKDLNLRMIQTLSQRYDKRISIGYSGHETSVTPSIIAGALGATVIERHITLDRAMWGTDHAASLEPAGLRMLVGALRKTGLVLGDGIKKEIPGEKEIAKKLRYWE
jgi:N-acetylneuraminate synthase